MFPAIFTELFRYRGTAKDGGALKRSSKAGEQNSPNAVTKEKATEIAANFMTTFYRVQVGALEAQEFFKGPMRQMLFVVLLSNGMVVEPDGPHASPKGLRHGFGVTAVSKGIALNMVQKWLGTRSSLRRPFMQTP